MINNTTHRGFTIFFAVLVSALCMLVGITIYDLTQRELSLSFVATQSQYAAFAADSGAECALYWDAKYTTVVPGDVDGSAFATSTNATGSGIATNGQINCNGQDIVANGTPPAVVVAPPTGWTSWVNNNPIPTATAATTTFTVYISTGGTQNFCSTVVVAKSAASVGGPVATTITAKGYNTCNSGDFVRVERVFQVSY